MENRSSKKGASSEVSVWRLKKGLDRRFRSGHPWAYSNELMESPKGLEPGAFVELRDAKGQFLARGYGNPHSLIAFRSLTRDPAIQNPFASEHLREVLARAHQLRLDLGFRDVSCRMVFGEADGLPGLIFDRYRTPTGQVWVFQAHTAGANRLLPQVLDVLETDLKNNLGMNAWENTSVVFRNDLEIRKLEGLQKEKPQVIKAAPGIDLRSVPILVRRVLGGAPLTFYCDLLEGQKTGFFLDQFSNIELVASRLQNWGGESIKILDLCSYVGQWGVQLGANFQKRGLNVEVTPVDASASALEFASRNLKQLKLANNPVKGDVLKELTSFGDRTFDLVIADPPALIKSRKDIPTGTHAYLQLFTQAIRLVRPGGAIVCCSCSGLLEEEVFSQVLSKATLRNQRLIRWVGRGSPSPDHPMLAEFPEGRYLKAWVGWVG